MQLQHLMNIDHKKKIKDIQGEFDHTIKFMDLSFEKAFDKKEKDFMLAYRVKSFGEELTIIATHYSNLIRD